MRDFYDFIQNIYRGREMNELIRGNKIFGEKKGEIDNWIIGIFQLKLKEGEEWQRL